MGRPPERAVAFGLARVKNADCISFLQWALPRLGLHWPGFRKVRRQPCRRIAKRIRELGLPDVAAYRRQLESDRDEWQVLAAQQLTRARQAGEDLLGAEVPEVEQHRAVDAAALLDLGRLGAGDDVA